MNEQKFNAIPENERFNRVLEGTAYYTFVHNPNMSPTKLTENKKWKGLPYFGVSLLLDEDNLARAEEIGLRILEANENIPGKHVLIQRKIKEDKDPESVKPEVVDNLQNPIPDTIAIGNGSKVLAKFATYWYDNHGGGVGTTFFKLQVKDLVPYEQSKDQDLEMNEDGFNINDYLTTAKSDSEGTTTVAKVEGQQEEGVTNPDIFDE